MSIFEICWRWATHNALTRKETKEMQTKLTLFTCILTLVHPTRFLHTKWLFSKYPCYSSENKMCWSSYSYKTCWINKASQSLVNCPSLTDLVWIKSNWDVHNPSGNFRGYTTWIRTVETWSSNPPFPSWLLPWTYISFSVTRLLIFAICLLLKRNSIVYLLLEYSPIFMSTMVDFQDIHLPYC